MKHLSFILTWFIAFTVLAKEPYEHPSWSKNATIYEMNLRQYTTEGTLRAAETHLPRLRAMGIGVIWLMPVFPIGQLNRKGSLGSYYSVKDYRNVNPEFGTTDDLKHFVNEAHAKGMKVILDWVANHSSFDNTLTTEHPDWYKHDSTGAIVPPVADWNDVAAFDYNNRDLRNYQIESMRYWLTTADVDGFRCDVAMMLPLDFWKECRLELDKTKKVFMLAEAEGPEYHMNGFDMTYAWEAYHLMNGLAKGEKKVADLDAYLAKNATLYRKDDIRMNFITNHDENSWNGTEMERLGAAAKAMFVLCATIPGMPLVYSGQEAGLDRRLKFFDKDPIDFRNLKDESFFTSLLQLKRSLPALANGANGGEYFRVSTQKPGVFVFLRIKGGSKVLTVLNLSDQPVKELTSEKKMAGDYKELFSNQKIKMFEGYNFDLKPWEYRVYYTK